MKFETWLESSLNELKQKAILAFPNTAKRQHAIDEIKIADIKLTPYVGVKTLYVKGLAQNTTNGKEYNSVILFKGLNYQEQKANNLAEIIVDGAPYYFNKLSLEDTEVLLRCNCKDFFWRFHHEDHEDDSLQGPNRKKYEGQGLWLANPLHLPGMCKHLMKLAEVLKESEILTN